MKAKVVSRALGALLYLLLLSNCLLAQSPPVFESFSSATGDDVAATVLRPPGLAAGELMVASVAVEKGLMVTITPPVNWTLVRRTDNGNQAGVATYWKVAGANEPDSYDFQFSTSNDWSVAISRISGADSSSPINASSGQSENNGNVIAPGLTTSIGQTLVLCFHVNQKGVAYLADPTTTKRYDVPNLAGNKISNMMASFEQATAGATTDKSATPAMTAKWSAQKVAIAPASPPAPVELLSFDARNCGAASVCLNWKTAIEVDNDYFTVERSIDAIRWEAIGTVNGAGTTTQPQKYSFIDDSPGTGVAYYRVKQTDYDGTFSYSPTEVVDTGTDSALINAYPNPSRGELYVSAQGIGLEQIQLYNAEGASVIHRVRTAVQSEDVVHLDLSQLPTGVYALRYGQSFLRIMYVH